MGFGKTFAKYNTCTGEFNKNNATKVNQGQCNKYSRDILVVYMYMQIGGVDQQYKIACGEKEKKKERRWTKSKF